jgi:hypothetical protein
MMMPEELELLDDEEELDELLEEFDEPEELELVISISSKPLLLLPESQAESRPIEPNRVARARQEKNLRIHLPLVR